VKSRATVRVQVSATSVGHVCRVDLEKSAVTVVEDCTDSQLALTVSS